MEVKILRDEDYEMVEIHVDGSLVFCGNYWDLSDDVWIDILSKVATVTEGTYSYE